MCGIAGKIDFGNGVDANGDRANVRRDRAPRAGFARDLVRRAGRARDPAPGDHRRGGGDQPIFNEDRTVAVVMNGEIYNFENSATADRRGHTIQHPRRHGGPGSSLRGSRRRARPASARHVRLCDLGRRPAALLLARDRVGKKPLLIARRDGKLWFASEMMALLQDPEIDRTPNLRAIAKLPDLPVRAPSTGVPSTGVEKLPRRPRWRSSAGMARQQRRYWSLDYRDAELTASDRASSRSVCAS